MTATCPWCNAPRYDDTTCPKCGADYAKAESIRKHGRATIAVPAPNATQEAGTTAEFSIISGPDPVEDPALELKFCIAAIPAMLLLGIFFNVFAHFLQRTFLSMPVHELGHAVASWLTGHWAIPTLWKTITSESRGLFMPIIVLGAGAYLVYRGKLEDNRLLVALGAALASLQTCGTFFISENTAGMLITFAGDAGGMIIGTILMMTFFFGKQTHLYKGSLRWGFVAIGAAAFVDPFTQWINAKRDYTNIPFGEIEGVALSDALRLSTEFGWSSKALISRHLTVGVLCLLALAAVYVWGVRKAWHAAENGNSRKDRA